MMMKFTVFILIFTVKTTFSQKQLYYVQTCQRDKYVNECLRDSGNKLIHYLREGVSDLNTFEIEPINIDGISIVLGSGPDGYRALFQNIEAFGVSNMTITNVRSNLESLEFQLTCYIPHISVRAQYRSSGVLILIKASGAGEYWGEYDGVNTKIYFSALQTRANNGHESFTVNSVKMDFNVKEITMGVDNIANGNDVIQAALNLFINSNAHELLQEMKPSLRSKFTLVIQNFLNNLFSKIPLNHWIQFI